jgi:hypothetical protein
MKPETLRAIIILAASCGVTLSSSTNSDGAHNVTPYTPVCAPALPSQETIRLRGYLKRSSQLVLITGSASAAVGKGRVDGATCSAHANDFRASS